MVLERLSPFRAPRLELVPLRPRFDINGQFFRGNSELQRGHITHYDLRWEWYPSESESVTLAVFYKDFQDPVEQILETSTEDTITFVNIDSANNYGLE
ncbi:MAG: hypothetical protein AAFX99_05710, partial [Myxococcota bacterium]